jgi:hypothetical protein
MTTAVTIDAHAGWPVEVIIRRGEPGTPDVFETKIIAPNSKETVYLHSGLSLVGIKELPRE